MKGWIYRMAVRIKELGERTRPRFVGRVLRNIGLALKSRVLDGWTVGEARGFGKKR